MSSLCWSWFTIWAPLLWSVFIDTPLLKTFWCFILALLRIKAAVFHYIIRMPGSGTYLPILQAFAAVIIIHTPISIAVCHTFCLFSVLLKCFLQQTGRIPFVPTHCILHSLKRTRTHKCVLQPSYVMCSSVCMCISGLSLFCYLVPMDL